MKNKELRRMFSFVALLAGLLCLVGCDKVFDVHPYDVHVDGDRDVNNANIAKIEQTCKDKKTLRVAVVSDSHQWLDDLDRAVDDINRRGDDIDFVVHCGDITDFGATQEFLWTRDHMKRLQKPFVVLLGNHDCLGTGNQAFKAVFGNPDFSFIVGGVKFLCLNTNAIEYDYSQPVPNFDFMEEQRSAGSEDFDRTMIFMHAAPYSEQFNNNVAKVFNYYTHQMPGLMCCVHGHGHHTNEQDIFGDGTIYYEVSSVHFDEYSIFTITPTGYSYEVIKF